MHQANVGDLSYINVVRPLHLLHRDAMYKPDMHEHAHDMTLTLTGSMPHRLTRTLLLALTVGFAVMLPSACMRTDRASTAAEPLPPLHVSPLPPLDVSPFILNAFLVPALDSDALPLRW